MYVRVIYTQQIIWLFPTHSDAAVASFSDDRCKTDGVCPSDPLTFTCEINGALSLRVELPNSHDDTVTLKNGPEDVDLPDGFTAVTLSIIEITDSSRNFTLTLSIAEASLLAGGEIRCDDTTPNNVAMAGCPIMGKSCKQLCFRVSAVSTSLYVWTQGHPAYYVSATSVHTVHVKHERAAVAA